MTESSGARVSLRALGPLAVVAVVAAVTVHGHPTFHTAVDLVTVQVAISAQDGSRVGDLGAGDFRLYEDGVFQDVALVSREPRPLSLCILLDSSPSMAGRESIATRAIDTILKTLDDDDEAALLMFAFKVRVALPWTRARDTRTFPWYGWRLALGTALIDAMKQALSLVEKAHNPLPVVVIVSDGGEMSSGTPLATLVSTRRQSETLVYGIRTAWPPSRVARPSARTYVADFLPDLVGDSGGRVYSASDAQGGEAAALSLLDELRSLYTLGYAPKKAMDGRYRHLKIDSTNPALVVRHRDGYLAQPRR